MIEVIEKLRRFDVVGLSVSEGDLIHADRHGAVSIPEDAVPALPVVIDTLLTAEQLVLETARGTDFDLEKLEVAWARYKQTRT